MNSVVFGGLKKPIDCLLFILRFLILCFYGACTGTSVYLCVFVYLCMYVYLRVPVCVYVCTCVCVHFSLFAQLILFLCV